MIVSLEYSPIRSVHAPSANSQATEGFANTMVGSCLTVSFQIERSLRLPVRRRSLPLHGTGYETGRNPAIEQSKRDGERQSAQDRGRCEFAPVLCKLARD